MYIVHKHTCMCMVMFNGVCVDVRVLVLVCVFVCVEEVCPIPVFNPDIDKSTKQTLLNC